MIKKKKNEFDLRKWKTCYSFFIIINFENQKSSAERICSLIVIFLKKVAI